MVDKVHIDLLVKVALDGPGEVGVCPGNAWNSLRWPDVDWPELQEMGWQEAGRHFRGVYLVEREGYVTPDELGLMLAAENLASIHYRYPDTVGSNENVPGPCDAYWADYTYADPGYRLTPAETLAALACYDYQSCEHPGWRTSEAFRFCDALRHAITRFIPGYEEAPWEWTAEHVAKRRAGVR